MSFYEINIHVYILCKNLCNKIKFLTIITTINFKCFKSINQVLSHVIIGIRSRCSFSKTCMKT